MDLAKKEIPKRLNIYRVLKIIKPQVIIILKYEINVNRDNK